MSATPPRRVNLDSQPWVGHGVRLRHASARVESVTAEILAAQPDDGSQSVASEDHASDGDEDVDEMSWYFKCSRRNGDDYDHEMEKARVLRLMGKLHLEEKDEILTDVRNQFRVMAAASKKAGEDLDRLDYKQERTYQEFDAMARNLLNDVDLHEHHTLDAMDHFQRSMANVRKSRCWSIAPVEQHKEEDELRALELLEHMTDEEIEREIAIIRTEISTKEKEALKVIEDMGEHETGKDIGDVDADVLLEQERIVVYMKETVKQIEGRGRLLKEAIDHMTGRSVLGVDGEFLELSHEAEVVIDELKEDIRQTLLPQLLAEREADHGDELRPLDDAYFNKVKRQCEGLEDGLRAADEVQERLTRAGALEEDMQEKLDFVNREGALPESVLLDANLEKISGISFGADSDSDDDLQENGGAVVLVDAQDVNEELKKEIRCANEEQRDMLNRLIEARRDENQVRTRYDALETGAKNMQRTLEHLSGQHQLFVDSLALARGAPLAGALPERARRHTNARSEAAAVAVAAMLGAADGPQGHKELKGERLWMDAFLSELGDTFKQDSFQIQSDVISAFAQEEVRLAQEIRELENMFLDRVSELTEKLRGGPDEAVLEQVAQGQTDARAALEVFQSSRKTLAEGCVEVVAELPQLATAKEALFSARCGAVKLAKGLGQDVGRRLVRSGTALGAATGQLAEALMLQEENHSMSLRIAAMSDEMTSLRARRDEEETRKARMAQTRKARAAQQVKTSLKRFREQGLSTKVLEEKKEEGKEETHVASVGSDGADADTAAAADQARELRRQTRALCALRAEVNAFAIFNKSRSKGTDSVASD